MRRNLLYRLAVHFLHRRRREDPVQFSSGIWAKRLMNTSISPIFGKKAMVTLNHRIQPGWGDVLPGLPAKGMYMRGRWLVVGLLVWAMLVGPVSQVAVAADASEKADFVAKLIDFVEWPAGKGTDASGSVVIACVGDSPVIASLKDAAARKSAEGMKVTVKTVAAGDPLAGSQMVFIGACDKAELAKVLKAAAGQPVLTVSNCTKFAQFGVMVNILDDSDGGAKVKFEVNTITVKEAGLKIGAQLLKLATVI